MIKMTFLNQYAIQRHFYSDLQLHRLQGCKLCKSRSIDHVKKFEGFDQLLEKFDNKANFSAFIKLKVWRIDLLYFNDKSLS